VPPNKRERNGDFHGDRPFFIMFLLFLYFFGVTAFLEEGCLFSERLGMLR
jgi:hypothetical protein